MIKPRIGYDLDNVFRALLLGAIIAAMAVFFAYGQTIGQQTISGNECWNAGQGPGGPTVGWLCANAIGAVQPTATNTGASSFTIGRNVATTILTAQPATSTITLPASPLSNGQIVEIVNGTTSAFATNVVTVAANTNQTLLGGSITITTLGAHASVEFRYNLANTTWYQLR